MTVAATHPSVATARTSTPPAHVCTPTRASDPYNSYTWSTVGMCSYTVTSTPNSALTSSPPKPAPSHLRPPSVATPHTSTPLPGNWWGCRLGNYQ